MTGPGVDILKQTIHGHSLDELVKLAPKGPKRILLDKRLRDIWADFAVLSRQSAASYVPPATADALPEIRHTDKIEVKALCDGFAEVSETSWDKLKLELFRAGLDADDVRLIARSLAKSETAGHGGGASPRYEYRRVANG